MGTGAKRHLKRVAAPKSWVLNKLGGVFAPKPSSGPHKFRESLPLILFLRNKLKYAVNGSEVKKILNQRLVRVVSLVPQLLMVNLSLFHSQITRGNMLYSSSTHLISLLFAPQK